uniref:Uncharacterized protein n=1 Tax=Varanus komodoensis TaxID=61221 RepID=A0A8D2IZ15_VARKO
MEGGQGAPAAGNLKHCPFHYVPVGEQDTPNLNSSMTTKELQEYWRKEKRNCREVKVVFEIPSAVIVEKPFSKYVKYQILIVQTGSFDSNRSMIERRYSDFERLPEQCRIGPSPHAIDLQRLENWILVQMRGAQN